MKLESEFENSDISNYGKKAVANWWLSHRKAEFTRIIEEVEKLKERGSHELYNDDAELGFREAVDDFIEIVKKQMDL